MIHGVMFEMAYNVLTTVFDVQMYTYTGQAITN